MKGIQEKGEQLGEHLEEGSRTTFLPGERERERGIVLLSPCIHSFQNSASS